MNGGWILLLTYKVLTTSQPDCLQSACRTRFSSAVTLARPSVSSSLKIANWSFRYASALLWNQLTSSFRQPHSVHSPGSPHPAHITSSQSSPLLLSLPRPFTTDLNFISFLHSLSGSLWTAFMDVNCAGVCFCFFLPRDALQCKARSCDCMSSVCPSVCNVGGLWLHRLEFFKNNFTVS